MIESSLCLKIFEDASNLLLKNLKLNSFLFERNFYEQNLKQANFRASQWRQNIIPLVKVSLYSLNFISISEKWYYSFLKNSVLLHIGMYILPSRTRLEVYLLARDFVLSIYAI